MSRITVDTSLCIRCGTCVDACSENVFVQRDADAVTVAEQEHLCIACGHCVALCPRNAIQHADVPPETVHDLDLSRVPDSGQLLELLRRRRSIREFRDTPVARAALAQILEAAQLAPSAHNFQRTEYIVIQDQALLARLSDLAVAYYRRIAQQLRHPVIRTLYGAVLSKCERESVFHLLPDFDMLVQRRHDGADPILHRAPCVVIAHTDPDVNFPETNAAIALHNATLMCEALGLGSFWLGYLIGACKGDRRIRAALNLPHGHRVYAAIALGYPKRRYARWVQRRAPRIEWK